MNSFVVHTAFVEVSVIMTDALQITWLSLDKSLKSLAQTVRNFHGLRVDFVPLVAFVGHI